MGNKKIKYAKFENSREDYLTFSGILPSLLRNNCCHIGVNAWPSFSMFCTYKFIVYKVFVFSQEESISLCSIVEVPHISAYFSFSPTWQSYKVNLCLVPTLNCEQNWALRGGGVGALMHSLKKNNRISNLIFDCKRLKGCFLHLSAIQREPRELPGGNIDDVPPVLACQWPWISSDCVLNFVEQGLPID